MKVVILCGGQGTRIRDVSDSIPKPMIPVGGLPILWHIMKYYACWGHKEFILCLGHMGQVIKDFFLNYETHTNDFTLTLGQNKKIEFHNGHAEEGWRITVVETGQHTMTGARVKRIRPYVLEEENFLLTYGDGVGNIDLDKLVAYHLAHRQILTVSGVRPPGRFGELVGDEAGRVIEFNEKPQASGGRISGGFFVCRQELFEYLDDRDDLVFEREPMEELVRKGRMMVYEHDGFWQPMDTYRDYLLLNGLAAKGKAPWMIW